MSIPRTSKRWLESPQASAQASYASRSPIPRQTTVVDGLASPGVCLSRSGNARPALHDVAGVASRLAVSTKTVRRMIDRGELSAHRIGRLLRISDEDLASFLSGRRTVP